MSQSNLETEESKRPKCYVRVSRLHANGGHNTRDVDILDRESWKRLCRGIKDTMIQGGEHHMRPLYKDDGPAVSAPAPLKLRVEALEEGIQKALVCVDQWHQTSATWSEPIDELQKVLVSLLLKKLEAKDTSA